MKTTGKKTTKDINVQSTTRYYGYLYHMSTLDLSLTLDCASLYTICNTMFSTLHRKCIAFWGIYQELV